MTNRYRNRRIVKNDLEMYSDAFKKRNIKHVLQYTTPELVFIKEKQYKNLIILKHVWKEGDRYYKLAETYYGNPKDWWIIATFNQLPTESDIAVGDIINIPTPVDRVLDYMGE
jgi:nucleoid-associated protein YgaU